MRYLLLFMTMLIAMPLSAAAETPSEKFVQDIGSQTLSIMSDKSIAPQQRTQKYHDILRSAFDLQTIGHFVLGRAWNMATPEQQQSFLKLFEQMVLETYGERMSLYAGEGFQVKSERKENEKDNVVSTVITHPDGSKPTSLDWRVRDNNGKLAVIDVVVEGVSQSVTQRQEFSAILQRNNGNIDSLLTMMKQRAQGAKAG